MGGPDILIPNFQVIKRSSELFPIVEKEILKRSNIYGDQTEALEKIKAGGDRRCELLVHNDKPLSLLIYKKQQEDIKSYNLLNSLEIKTFLPIDKCEDDNNMVNTLKHILNIAQTNKADNVHVTVSEREKQTFRFLLKHQFEVCETWQDKYVQGVKEYLMMRNINKETPKEEEETKASCSNVDTHHRDEESRKRKHEDTRDDSSSWKQRRYDHHNRRNDRQREHFERPRTKPKYKSCTLKKKYVHLIRDGVKTVEGRIASTMFKDWKEGDIIKFHYFQPPDHVFVRIDKVTKYNTFRDLLVAEGVTKCIPDVNTIEQGVRIYDGLPGYKDKERRFGVLGFQMKVVSEPK